MKIKQIKKALQQSRANLPLHSHYWRFDEQLTTTAKKYNHRDKAMIPVNISGFKIF